MGEEFIINVIISLLCLIKTVLLGVTISKQICKGKELIVKCVIMCLVILFYVKFFSI